MRTLSPSSEAEMIATFLGQELRSSDRYGTVLGEALISAGVPEEVIRYVDLSDAGANAARRRVLAAYRGYGTGERSYLTGFPDHGVDWFWAALTPADVLAVRYIRYSYWVELSAGTRLASVAADRVRAGITVFGVSNGPFWDVVAHLRQGHEVPPLIVVTAGAGRHVVLEGHRRLTAFALAPDVLPAETTVLVGASPDIARWGLYGD